MLKIINYEVESNTDLLIVHISDIHYSNHYGNRLKKVINELKKAKPDYICITGDTIDNLGVTKKKAMSEITNYLDELSKISKVIMCLGNHDTRDYKGMKDNKWYEKLNKDIIVLNNTYYEDDNICFYGLTIDDEYYHHEKDGVNELTEELSKIKLSNKYNILLFHSPVNFEKEEVARINKFDLVLVGHTHNGLTHHIVPGNFGLVAPSHGFYLKNARYSFKSGKSKVIISGGVTKLSVGTGMFHIFNVLFTSDLNYIYLKKDKKS